MSRPQILFPLFAGLDTLPGVGPKTAKHFAQIDVEIPRDLLFSLPYSGVDRRLRDTVKGIDAPRVVTVEVEVLAHIAPLQKGRPYRVSVKDSEITFQLVFFHAREDWLQQQLPIGARRVVSGKVENFDNVVQIVHPDHIVPVAQAREIPAFEPVYPLTGGISLKLMTKAVQGALQRVPEVDEWIDAPLLVQKGWPRFNDALIEAHAPKSVQDVSPQAPPRLRLAYDEFFAHQVTLALARSALKRAKGVPSSGSGALRSKVLSVLPYTPTSAQNRAIGEIAADMASDTRMNRLLQGDVGSGKTLVAFLALLIGVEAGGQGVMMAPTEILARQHLESLQPLAEAAGVVLEILTGRDKGRERAAKLGALKSGKIHVLVGTHAVFQKDVEFNDLRLAIIDEQHRFGVSQRMELGAKGQASDVLVMTATPIPRSLALAQFGDLDVSVLDEKPPGRKPITTALVSSGRMDEVIQHLKNAITNGRQAYWVCPLVAESEVLDLAAATDRFNHLRAQLGDTNVGLVHGQMPSVEKDAAMAAFVAGETAVLVATTVIEVGVDVPNATIMVVERAEHFGLSQLHQLRGRVGRGAAQSTCLLLYQAPLTQGGKRRLEILRDTEDGFRISQEDLEMRGAGDVIGKAQSGLPRFRVADIERQTALMATAQTDARKLLHDDPTLQSRRGAATRVLLWLMNQDQAIRLISVG